MLDARHRGSYSLRIERARARNAFERDVIDISTGKLTDELHALFSGCGRKQENQIDVGCFELGGKFDTFLWGVIHDQNAINARACCIANKSILAVLEVIAFYRIGITHKHNGRRCIFSTEGFHHLQHLSHADAECQRAIARFLNHGAIC